MANKRISSLDPLATPAVDDIIPVTDIDDLTGSPQGTTKKVTVANLVAVAPQGDLESANNLSDLADATTARTNLGVDAAGTDNSTDVTLDTTSHDYLSLTGQTVSLGAIDLAADVTGLLPNTSVSGLGTAATQDVGTSNGNVVQLDATGLPAVDGSQLTNVSGTDSTKLAIANNLSDLNDATTARTNLGLGTAATSASTDFSPAFFTIVSETTTSRTLSNSDNGKVIVCSNSAATTVTIPSGLTSGFGCTVVQNGTGVVSIEGSGATVYGFGNKTATAGQYGSINVYNVGTNAYVLEGDTQSPPFVNGFSLDFDGSNDYVDAGSSPSGLTIEGLSVWFRPDSTFTTSGPLQYLLGFGGSDIGIALGGDWFWSCHKRSANSY